MNKRELIQIIKDSQDFTGEQKSELIELVNTKKKYGLVWEDKPEDVEEQLRTMLPVFNEVKEHAIISEDKDAPNHTLIEGDNLHALTGLTYTHDGQIDMIYIDPPYNTGNKDFIYNDHYVDREDSYRHSKWLSFMEKRLKISKQLLSSDGVIFISIDDNELSQLKLLCDEVFGHRHHVATLPVVMNLKGNQDKYGFTDTHEYCLVYTKNYQVCKFGYFLLDEEEIFKEWEEDEYGYFKKADGLRATGVNAPREKRPNLFYPIFINPESKNFYTTENDEPISENDITLWPINSEGVELSWYWKKSNVNDFNYNLILTNARGGGYSIYKKQRPALGDIPTRKPKSIFYKSDYSTSSSTTRLKNMFGKKVFNAPKPVPFIFDLIQIGLPKGGVVLDFFAGSGTTLEALIKHNQMHNRSNSAILITNNENNIAEEVTYLRNKKLIKGYTNLKGEYIEGIINNNLRYYKTSFIPSVHTEANRRLLTVRSTELLCIKENCYVSKTTSYELNEKQTQIFTNNKGKFLIVVYHSRNQLEVIDQLSNIILDLETTEKIKIYAFGTEKEVLEDDFYRVIDKIDVVPLPDSIYNAYRATFQTLNLDRKEPISSISNEE